MVVILSGDNIVRHQLYSYLKEYQEIDAIELVNRTTQEKIRIVNKRDRFNTIFVSLQEGDEFQVYTTRGNLKSDDLAIEIGLAVKPLYESISQNLKYESTDEKEFFVLKNVTCSSVLIKCDTTDTKLLAQYIYQGIMNFLVYEQQYME